MMQHWRYRLLFSACSMLWGMGGLAAQQTEAVIERLGVEQGFPMGLFNAVMQDSRGFIWAGGYAGLIRHDGYGVVHYVNDALESTSIGDNKVSVIREDRAGQGLWIGTQNGLYYFDRKTEAFTRYLPEGAGRHYIFDLCELESGQLWVLLSLPNGVGLFDPATQVFSKLELNEQGPISALHRSRDGTVWAGGSKGLFTADAASLRLQPVPLAGADGQPWKPSPIRCIIEGPPGTLWMGSENSIISYDRQAGIAQRTSIPFPLDAPSDKRNVNAILMDRHGRLWCGASDGLYRYNPQSEEWKVSRHDPDFERSLSSSVINSIYEDHSGAIWLATLAGVNLLHPTAEAFGRFRTSYQGGMKGVARLRSFHEWTPGQLLLWEKTGLTIWDWQTDRKTPFPYQPADRAAWNSGVYTFYQDQQGRLWMGTLAGVFVFDPSTKTFAHYHQDSGNQLALSSNHVRDVCQDRQGAIWIATWDGGVNRLDERAGKVQHYLNSAAERATYQYGARRVFVDRSGTLWAGTRGGLHRYDRANDRFKRYSHDPGDPNSIGENTAFDIYEDEQGYLWIGTYGGGLNRFDPKTETFQRYTIKDGLPDNNVFSILPDDNGHLWLSGYVSIVKFDPKREVFQTLDFRDGLLNKHFDAFSHYRSPYSGELIYEGKQGIDIFHPDDIRPDSTLPLLRFTNFLLYNQPVPIRRGGKPGKGDGFQLEQAISETERLTLPYHASRVMTFEFAGLHFANPEKNRYAYFLEGFDRERQYIERRRSATFTNLPPGKYTLWIYASNANGIWDETGASIALHIQPPWWLTWWAFALYALAAAGIIYAFLHYQRRRWRWQAALAEQQREAQRLKELDAFKSQLYDNFTHEFRTPLTVILGLADEIPKYHQKEQTGHLVRAVEMVRRNGFRLLQIVNQILDLSKLEAGMLPVNMIQADSVALLRYLSDSFQSLADAKHIAMTFEAAPADLLMDIDEEKLTTIYSNLLSNAVKFTDEGGSIAIKVSKQESADAPLMVIEVSDTGIGIPQNKLPHVFDRFYQVNDSDNSRHGLRLEGGTGIGLTLTKELVELLGGTIEAESEEGRGACFRVQLPVSNKAPLQPEGALFSIAPVPADRAAVPAAEPLLPSEELPTLLIVEDSPDIITYLRACLEGQYRILTAASGRRGLETAIENVPDLIISDVMMPEMDGFQLCETLKNDERTSHIPIVLLTARVDAESRLKGLGRGADAYLGKPFNLEELKLQLANLNSLQQKLRARYQNLTPLPPTEDPALQIEDEFVAKARQAVYDHMDDSALSVEHLMRILGVSRTQLHNKLKALTGRSATDFIRFVRLQHARELLRTTKKTVAEVAYATGFNTPGYFTRRYQEEFGELPGKKNITPK